MPLSRAPHSVQGKEDMPLHTQDPKVKFSHLASAKPHAWAPLSGEMLEAVGLVCHSLPGELGRVTGPI